MRNIIGIKIEELRGKLVLDIGSGGGRFFNEAREKGIDVVAFEPKLGDGATFRKLYSSGKKVAVC